MIQNQNRWSQVWTQLCFSRHWTFLVCDNEDEDEQRVNDSISLSLSLLLNADSTPCDSKGNRTLMNCYATSPPGSQTANQGCCGCVFTGSQQACRFTVLSVKLNWEKHVFGICLCHPSVWSSDYPTTIALIEIAVRDYLFGEPHLFFKWPYLSLKNGTMGTGMFVWFLSISMFMVVRRVIRLCHRTWGICGLVLLAGGVSIMSRLLCLKYVALAVSVSDFRLVFITHLLFLFLFSHKSPSYRGENCSTDSDACQSVWFLQCCHCSISSWCGHVRWSQSFRSYIPLNSVSPPTTCVTLPKYVKGHFINGESAELERSERTPDDIIRLQIKLWMTVFHMSRPNLIFFIYVWIILCVPHICVKLKKMKQNNKLTAALKRG